MADRALSNRPRLEGQVGNGGTPLPSEGTAWSHRPLHQAERSLLPSCTSRTAICDQQHRGARPSLLQGWVAAGLAGGQKGQNDKRWSTAMHRSLKHRPRTFLLGAPRAAPLARVCGIGPPIPEVLLGPELSPVGCPSKLWVLPGRDINTSRKGSFWFISDACTCPFIPI